MYELSELSLRLLKFILIFMRTLFIAMLECIIPGNWYAKDVDQDIVLITGAGSGLGRAVALEYARQKSSLVLWDINEKGLQETKNLVESEYEKINDDGNEEKGPRICSLYIVDVSDRLEVQKWAQQVMVDLNEERKIDQPEKYISVLVNNAGIYHGLMFHELKDEQIEKIFKINILAHFWTVRAFLPYMIEHERGHIVEIASMAGIFGLFKQVDYCATKFATVGFEESLSMELEEMGLSDKIKTTVICTFFFSSNLFTGFDSRASSLMKPEFVAKETVMAMRCNHTRVMLPKLMAYAVFVLKIYLPKKSLLSFSRLLGFVGGIKEIKGRAATVL